MRAPCGIAILFLATFLSIGSHAITSPVESPCFTNISVPHLSGFSALVVVTSHSKLGDQNCSTCKPTGVYGEEMTAPYLLFRDAGMRVTIATIQGGDVPIDPTYNSSLLQTSFDKRFYADAQAYVDSHNTPSIAQAACSTRHSPRPHLSTLPSLLRICSHCEKQVDFAHYDIIFMAGGWGAAWDLGTSDVLARRISEA
jgi:putative intracellular protease/amidase